MKARTRPSGIWAAVVTPVDDTLRPDAGKAAGYYARLLDSGCDGINLLGTTGEAMSFPVAQRVALMEAVAEALPADRVMCGAGAASLDDAVTLARAAFACGFIALVMPPFFFRDAGDDGILRFFDVLFRRAKPPANGVLLYNFPRMSGITFGADLTERIARAFEGAIAGIKDSSNDAALQAGLLARDPSLAVFASSEADLDAALARGAAGCISGSVALWPALAQRAYRTRDASAIAELAALRQAIGAVPLVGAVKYAVARETDAEWERNMPPLETLTPAQREAVDGVLSRRA